MLARSSIHYSRGLRAFLTKCVATANSDQANVTTPIEASPQSKTLLWTIRCEKTILCPMFQSKRGGRLCCSFVTLHIKINTSSSPAGTKAALFASSRCNMTALLNCASEAISLQDTSCMASIMYCPKSLLALWLTPHYYLSSSRARLRRNQ